MRTNHRLSSSGVVWKHVAVLVLVLMLVLVLEHHEHEHLAFMMPTGGGCGRRLRNDQGAAAPVSAASSGRSIGRGGSLFIIVDMCKHKPNKR